jgi:hypothetical protein
MSSATAVLRAAVPTSSARAEASRKNGAKSRGPRTAAGKARAAQNALKHGLRAQKYLVLPDEDAAEFADLEAALVRELAPVGALQAVLARRVAVAAWRLARADRLETELFEERRGVQGGLGLALIRDGNGARSFETLLRYRGAAMAEFWRALRTLKALQAEQARQVEEVHLTGAASSMAPRAHVAQPNEPERRVRPRLEYAQNPSPASGGSLHEDVARWTPNEPELARAVRPAERTSAGVLSHRQTAAGRAGRGLAGDR